MFTFPLIIIGREYRRARDIASQKVIRNVPNVWSIPILKSTRISPKPKDFFKIFRSSNTPQIISGRYILPRLRLKKKKSRKQRPSITCTRFLGTELLR